MEIEFEQEGNGRWTAEINLNKLYTCVTGGVIYAYGSTKAEAQQNLIQNVKTFIDLLSGVEGEEYPPK